MIRKQTVEFIDSHEIDQKIKDTMKELVTASVQHAMRAPLRARFKDLPTSDMKEILLQRMLEEHYDKGHEDYKMAYEALQKSIIRDESEQFDADKAEERTKKKRASDKTGASDSIPDPPPPPPSPTTNPDDQSQGLDAPGLTKTAASTAYTSWTTTTSRVKPSASSIPKDVLCMKSQTLKLRIWCLMMKISTVGTFPNLHVPANNWASVIASSYVPPPRFSLLS
ncbi:hypothetical protein Tco_0712822 [Tanacetum coccineum]